MAEGSSSCFFKRMEEGTVLSMSSSRLFTPMIFNICFVSASFGPMCLEMNSCCCSSNRFIMLYSFLVLVKKMAQSYGVRRNNKYECYQLRDKITMLFLN